MFLTHKDDVADHQRFADRFNCQRVVYADDGARRLGVEQIITGEDAVKSIRILSLFQCLAIRAATWWFSIETSFSSPAIIWRGRQIPTHSSPFVVRAGIHGQSRRVRWRNSWTMISSGCCPLLDRVGHWTNLARHLVKKRVADAWLIDLS